MSKFVKALHSEDSPKQVAWGFALGAIPGLTPLWGLHNLLVLILVLIIRVNAASALFSFAVFSLLAVMLSPVFHITGFAVLTKIPFLTGLWTALYNAPLAPFTRFNETLAMGGFLVALILLIPNYFLFRFLVEQYRKKWKAEFERWKIIRVIKSSKIVQFYLKLKTLGN
ncbi:MAG: TIGR03546 family protein [Bacteroidales bacterium]|nr:TIGR03546 family protein [Bacteroidales bacterium]